MAVSALQFYSVCERNFLMLSLENTCTDLHTMQTLMLVQCGTYNMDEACRQKWLNGTYYSLCWQKINVWMLSKWWSQYIFLPRHSCPKANTWLLQRNTTLSRHTGSVTAQTVVSSSPMFPWTKGGSALCIRAKAPSLSRPHSANSSDLPCSGERQHVGVRSRAKRFQSAECIWAEVCLQTKNSIQLVIERVWTARVKGHIWCKEEGLTSGNTEYPNWSHFLHWAAAKAQPLTYISPTQQVWGNRSQL